MNSVPSRPLRLLVLAAAATASVALSSTALAQPGPTTQPVTNGGSRQWIAYDPPGRSIGSVQFLNKIIQIVNTSNQPNAFTLTYEPQHLLLCAATLGPGIATLCGLQTSQHVSGGYFQVVAQQGVLMGGYVDMPTIGYTMDIHGAVSADTSHGTIQNMPLVWQAGCPPRPGSGCPDGKLATGVGTVAAPGATKDAN